MKRMIVLFLFLECASGAIGQVKELTAGDVKLHYTDEGSGVPVILIHGNLEDYRSWEAFSKLLANEYKVITYSRRYNHPNRNQANSDPHSIGSDVEDLYTLITSLGVDKAHILGKDYGGSVALAFGIKYPQFVRSLTFSDPPIVSLLTDSEEGQEYYADFYNNLLRPVKIAFDLRDTADVLRHTINYFATAGAMADLSPEAKRIMIENFAEWKAFVNFPEAFSGVSHDDLEKINAPMMLISSGTGYPFSEKINEILIQKRPDMKRYTLPSGQPGFWNEHIREIPRILREFFQNN